MKNFLLVGFGGFAGSTLRYFLSRVLIPLPTGNQFPTGTFVVNVLGCLAGGALAGLVEKNNMFSPEMRTLLFTGILGGFTTFSAFALESVQLYRRGEPVVAGVYILSSVVAGLGAFALGLKGASSWS